MEIDLSTTNGLLAGMLAVQVIILIALVFAVMMLTKAIAKLNETADTLGARVSRLIDEKAEPILEEVRQRAAESEKIVENITLVSESVERIGKAVAEKDDDIKAIIGNCRQVTEGVTEATRGVRDTVIPAVDQVSRLVRAFRRGVEVFGSAQGSKKGDLND